MYFYILLVIDFLRRSGASGYFLPLSGGADSSAVAAIVHTMTSMLHAHVHRHPSSVTAKDLRRLMHQSHDDTWLPTSSQELADQLFTTCYMGTSNSSESTDGRARRLATAIGSYHLTIKIDLMVEAVLKVFQLATGKFPKYESKGGKKDLNLIG